MADPTPRLILDSDLVEPDWQSMDAGDVWLAAQQGVPEATAELAKREAAFATDPAARRRASGPTAAQLRGALRRRR